MGYSFFENKECEYYPCHKAERINCLFCFCPLYGLNDCGGDFKIIIGKDKKRIKDCSDCTKAHDMATGYDFVLSRLNKEFNK